MRRFIRAAIPPLAAFVLAGILGFACADDDVETEERPGDAELITFYTEFCTRLEECAPEFSASWNSGVECAEFAVATYRTLPTACLNRLIEYQRCVIEQECEKFNTPTPAEECRPLKQALDQVDCGGMPAP